jgi:4-alpha-glucanotransferase
VNGHDDQLRELARAHGVYLDFFDLHGAQHAASPDTLRALLRGLGVAAKTDAEVSEALAVAREALSHMPREQVVRADQTTSLPATACSWTIIDEAGQIVCDGISDTAISLPALGVGYFHLHAKGDGWSATTFVLSRPARAPDLQSQCHRDTCWGATGALYGLRSQHNGGLGNYSDLGTVTAALGGKGAQFFGVNPLHAIGWAEEDIISPYSPSHRGAFNTDHIAVDDGLGKGPKDAFIDYKAFRAIQRGRLETDYKNGASDRSDYKAWCDTCPEDLRQCAIFEAISERHGYDFRTWPQALRTPGPKAEQAAGIRADFHLWLQWLADTQIDAAQARAKDAGMALGLYLDLAVGPRPDGAEVWMNGATIAQGVTIGAPPDHLSPEGQSWALAAHAPGRLAAAEYKPVRSILHSLMAKCGLLRIDHALGLLRSFWIPDDGSPGGYITQPLDALLAVIMIEAHRAGCVVVGEDLGLVPDGFRKAMNNAGIYSYAVWQFEATHLGDIRPAQTLPPFSLTCFSTHDTPTLRGFWYGNDIEWWHHVGWIAGTERKNRHAQRSRQRASLRNVTNLANDATADTVTDTLQAALAASPAALVSVQLDDVFGELEAQNLPGTIDAHPNWRRRLNVPVEKMADHPALQRVSDVMNAHRGPGPAQDDMKYPKEVSA